MSPALLLLGEELQSAVRRRGVSRDHGKLVAGRARIGKKVGSGLDRMGLTAH